MKNYVLALAFATLAGSASAQPTWSGEAAQVIYDNCTECHHPDGVGPMSLLEYGTAYDYRSLILSYVEYNIMPPWTADTSFQHYFDERVLTEYERNTIIDWASAGALEGDPDIAPPPPVYTGDQILPAEPDLVVEMPNYMSKATVEFDDYICLSIPTDLPTDKKIKAIEIIPGNRSIVHHCLMYLDAEGTYETDSIGGDCGGPTDLPLMAGYTPGARPTIFPSSDDFSAGIVMPAGSSVVFAMHYPHGSYGQWDQTRVNFYFYPEPTTEFREISAGAYIQNWWFDLPADEVTDVDFEYPDLPFDLTVMSTFPHMHLLGKSIKAYGLAPDGDTVKFVNIPEWDFDWQDFYWFEYMQHLPSGSTLVGEGVYDNTTANPHNPSDPPIDVGPGLNTTDEMFLVYFHVMEYWEGDELVNLDSLNSIYLEELGIADESLENGGIKAYPNPFDETITIEYDLTKRSQVNLYIYDMNGKVVNKLYRGQQELGQQQVIWDGTSNEGTKVANGLYHYSMLINGEHYSGRIIKN